MDSVARGRDVRQRADGGEFYDHYTAIGWVQNTGRPIVDWHAALSKWVRNEIKWGRIAKPEDNIEERKAALSRRAAAIEAKNAELEARRQGKPC